MIVKLQQSQQSTYLNSEFCDTDITYVSSFIFILRYLKNSYLYLLHYTKFISILLNLFRLINSTSNQLFAGPSRSSSSLRIPGRILVVQRQQRGRRAGRAGRGTRVVTAPVSRASSQVPRGLGAASRGR